MSRRSWPKRAEASAADFEYIAGVTTGRVPSAISPDDVRATAVRADRRRSHPPRSDGATMLMSPMCAAAAVTCCVCVAAPGLARDRRRAGVPVRFVRVPARREFASAFRATERNTIRPWSAPDRGQGTKRIGPGLSARQPKRGSLIHRYDGVVRTRSGPSGLAPARAAGGASTCRGSHAAWCVRPIVRTMAFALRSRYLACSLRRRGSAGDQRTGASS